MFLEVGKNNLPFNFITSNDVIKGVSVVTAMKQVDDQEWESIKECFPEDKNYLRKNGRKPVPARDILDAALWVAYNDAQWYMLPQCYPNYKTVHRRFKKWCQDRKTVNAIIKILDDRKIEGSGLPELEIPKRILSLFPPDVIARYNSENNAASNSTVYQEALKASGP